MASLLRPRFLPAWMPLKGQRRAASFPKLPGCCSSSLSFSTAPSWTNAASTCAARAAAPRRPRVLFRALPVQQRCNASRRSRNSNNDLQSPATRTDMATALTAYRIAFRMPQTFVPPSMTPYLRTPKAFAQLLWIRCRTFFADRFAELAVRLQSKPAFFQAARYKPNRKALGPIARSLHAQMLEAIAGGDLRTLSRLLTKTYYGEMGALLARRPKTRHCRWELLAYHGSPRVVDSKIVMFPGFGDVYCRQHVVRIRSRQRFTWTDDTQPAGSPPLSVSEQDITENLVLVATLNRTTWQTSEWRVFGFVQETTLEQWQQEKAMMDQAQRDKIPI